MIKDQVSLKKDQIVTITGSLKDKVLVYSGQ